MKTNKIMAIIPGIAGVAFPGQATACAVCFGAPDSPMTQGLNAGILFLLGVVILVLSGIAGFAVHLARKQTAPPESRLPSTPRSV
jgi:hypothetical protein